MKTVFKAIFFGGAVVCFYVVLIKRMERGLLAPLFPPIYGDLPLQTFPWLTFVKESVSEGVFPFWNPYQGVGQTHFAQGQSGILYPANWVIHFLDIPHAMVVIHFMSVAIAMTGTLLYLRLLRVEWPGVIVASILFGHSAFLISLNPYFGSSYCWLPVALWAFQRLLDTPKPGHASLFAIFLALSYLGGSPQHFYYILVVVLVYSLSMAPFFLSRHNLRSNALRIGLIASAFLLMTGLVFVQLLPGLELSLNSVRNIAGKINRPPADYWPTGNLIANMYRSKESLHYAGSALLLVPLALGSKRQREAAIALLASWAYIALFVLSKQKPALAVFGMLPLSDAFYALTRFLDCGPFMVASLAGIGLSSFWDRTPLKLVGFRSGKFNLFWILTISYVFALSFGMHRVLLKLRAEFLPLIVMPFILLAGVYSLYSSCFSLMIKGFGISFLLLTGLMTLSYHMDLMRDYLNYILFINTIMLVVALLSRASLLCSRTRKVVLWILTLLLISELWMWRDYPRFELFAHIRPNTSVSLAEWARGHDGYDRAIVLGLHPNSGCVFRFFNVDSYDSFAQARWANYIRFMVGTEEFKEALLGYEFRGLITGVITGPQIWQGFLSHARMAGLLSVRYFVSDSPLDVGDKAGRIDWELVRHEDAPDVVYVYENKHSLPRAYLTDTYMVTHDEGESLAAIRENLENLKNAVILENAAPSFPSTGLPNSGSVCITRYEINRVELQLETDRPSILVLTDAYYPGWSVLVDGEKKPIWRANSLFKAVEIQPGTHAVTFRFLPTNFVLGVSVSLVSILLVAAGFMIDRRYGGRPSRAADASEDGA